MFSMCLRRHSGFFPQFKNVHVKLPSGPGLSLIGICLVKSRLIRNPLCKELARLDQTQGINGSIKSETIGLSNSCQGVQQSVKLVRVHHQTKRIPCSFIK